MYSHKECVCIIKIERDRLLYASKDIGADYIITCNVEDFKNSEVKAITPDDFINLWTNLCKL